MRLSSLELSQNFKSGGQRIGDCEARVCCFELCKYKDLYIKVKRKKGLCMLPLSGQEIVSAA